MDVVDAARGAPRPLGGFSSSLEVKEKSQQVQVSAARVFVLLVYVSSFAAFFAP